MKVKYTYFILALLVHTFAWAITPMDSDEKLLIRTSVGDLVFILYPEVAPKHVDQIKNLVNLGVYDGLNIFRIEPGFHAQVSTQYDRLTPLTPEQAEAIRKIAAEFNSIPHARGILSMARSEDPDSAEVSFSILLGSANHLNGKYTVFGKLEKGEEVLSYIEKTPLTPENSPKNSIIILKAEIVTAQALEKIELKNPKYNKTDSTSGLEKNRIPIMFLLITLMMGLGMAFLKQKYVKYFSSLALLVVLVSAFGIFILSHPLDGEKKWISAVLFIGMIGIFKLLSRFESPSK
jgi:cyclophilin family peptidyl-prolyl cis-trans isomerase